MLLGLDDSVSIEQRMWGAHTAAMREPFPPSEAEWIESDSLAVPRRS